MSEQESFIDDDYSEIFRTVSKAIKGRKITAANIIYLAGLIMEEVESQNDFPMNGYDKKQFVVNALKEVVRLSKDIPADDKPALYVAIQNLVPGAIDLIVAGANGDLAINLQEITSCCFGKKQQEPKTRVSKQMFDDKVKHSKK